MFHKRSLLIDFQMAKLFIYKDQAQQTPQKTINLKDIIKVDRYDIINQEVNQPDNSLGFNIKALFKGSSSKS